MQSNYYLPAVGSVISCCDLAHFGRIGTVVKLGRAVIYVRLHLTGATVRIHPDSFMEV